jgi:hypothetical protein
MEIDWLAIILGTFIVGAVLFTIITKGAYL